VVVEEVDVEVVLVVVEEEVVDVEDLVVEIGEEVEVDVEDLVVEIGEGVDVEVEIGGEVEVDV
jgi:hypothetical protein